MRHYEVTGAVMDRPQGSAWDEPEDKRHHWKVLALVDPKAEIVDAHLDWLLTSQGPLVTHMSSPARRELVAADQLRETFEELASVWKHETSMAAFMPQKAIHWAYQRIIGMGAPVVPLILDRLRTQGPDHWFWALAMITGVDPASGMTTLGDATNAWLEWGRAEGLL